MSDNATEAGRRFSDRYYDGRLWHKGSPLWWTSEQNTEMVKSFNNDKCYSLLQDTVRRRVTRW